MLLYNGFRRIQISRFVNIYGNHQIPSPPLIYRCIQPLETITITKHHSPYIFMNNLNCNFFRTQINTVRSTSFPSSVTFISQMCTLHKYYEQVHIVWIKYIFQGKKVGRCRTGRRSTETVHKKNNDSQLRS